MDIKTYFYILGEDECDCPPEYVKINDSTCQKVETMEPEITSSNFCLAPSRLEEYSQYFTRIYTSEFDNTTIGYVPNHQGEVLTTMNNIPQWRSSSSTDGPMNRAGVWIDSDCDGVKDPLQTNSRLTLSFIYNNQTEPKTIYVGIGADNQFELHVNEINIAKTVNIGADGNFKIWHIFPVFLKTGLNYFNAVAIGDGSVNDSIGMTIYNNTAEELVNATSDAQLDILFTTANLIGQTIDIANCPAGWSLDTTGGSGSYICKRTLTIPCE